MTNKIKEYLLNNEGTLLDVVNELNCLDGCLEHLCFFENNNEFFNTFFDTPMQIIKATDSADYDYRDEYVKFNKYGNLVTYSTWEKNLEIKNHIDDVVECLVEYYEYITIDDENLENLLSEEDEEEE